MTTFKETNALSEITVGELIDKLNVPKVKGALYSLFHHTKTESFANMVNGGSVWMSRIDQMNDGTEVFKDADRTYAFTLPKGGEASIRLTKTREFSRRKSLERLRCSMLDMSPAMDIAFMAEMEFIILFQNMRCREKI